MCSLKRIANLPLSKNRARNNRDFAQAKSLVFRLLKFRNRSTRELAERLKRKGFSEDIITQSIAYFRNLQLVDDVGFTEQWIRAKLSRGYGFLRIAQELSAKGITHDEIKSVWKVLHCRSTEQQKLRELMRAKKVKYVGSGAFRVKQKILGYFMRRGFAYSDVCEALENQ